MFIPSDRNWQEMKYEPAGCWPLPINRGDEFALITKMPTSSIKAAYKSCPVSLTVARANTPDGVVLATTLTVADDPSAPLLLSGAVRHEEEQLALERILQAGQTLIVFFDELSRPVAHAKCTLAQPQCSEASAMVVAAGSRYIGPWSQLLSDVLDEVQAHADPQYAVFAKYCPTFFTMEVICSDFATMRTKTIGSDDNLEYRLDDPDEGFGLEQSTWHVLENLFQGRIAHSPHVREGKKLRELSDILTSSDVGVCLFEAKAAAVLSTNPDRGTEKRVKSVQKQIDKGIGQLIGALRNVRCGLPLVTKTGEDLILPPGVGNVHQGIIMVSEMLPGLNWDAIGAQLLSESEQSGTMLHILDLTELRLLVGISCDDPFLFAAYLSHRFDIMAERRHAMIRMVLDGPPMP